MFDVINSCYKLQVTGYSLPDAVPVGRQGSQGFMLQVTGFKLRVTSVSGRIKKLRVASVKGRIKRLRVMGIGIQFDYVRHLRLLTEVTDSLIEVTGCPCLNMV